MKYHVTYWIFRSFHTFIAYSISKSTRLAEFWRRASNYHGGEPVWYVGTDYVTQSQRTLYRFTTTIHLSQLFWPGQMNYISLWFWKLQQFSPYPVHKILRNWCEVIMGNYSHLNRSGRPWCSVNIFLSPPSCHSGNRLKWRDIEHWLTCLLYWIVREIVLELFDQSSIKCEYCFLYISNKILQF